MTSSPHNNSDVHFQVLPLLCVKDCTVSSIACVGEFMYVGTSKAQLVKYQLFLRPEVLDTDDPCRLS
jgi:hypothetical protein